MYKGMKSAILTNGYQSPYLSVTRGIRQGDSLSALLYIIQAHVRNNNDFEGIRLGDQSIIVKGCQYVDDSNKRTQHRYGSMSSTSVAKHPVLN